MFLFFQTVFTVAAPLQDGLEGVVLGLGEGLRALLPAGLLQSLVVDGVIAGVGGVVVFVPQIALLLVMISLLEGSGYMARAAFLIDRVMGWAGLEGRCFVALLSSYACAIPGIMATRAVPDPKSRLATIMVAPLMTCSARLPVYGLLIGAFVPAQTVAGVFQVQGLAMFGLYLLGSLSALAASVVFKKGVFRGHTYPFYMELPPYRFPSWRTVAQHVWRGVRSFLRKAGTTILAASVILWALLTFPQVEPPAELAQDEAAARSWQLERSVAGHIGKAIEPTISPLGFDWRIGISLLASFSAREVMVSTLGQLYAFSGDEEDLEGLGARLKAAKKPDGAPAYTLAVALSLLVFYVYSLQCVSTLAVMRRETGSWRWPALGFAYMLALAWVGSFVTYRLALALA
jgi:ferrous iron transport protein B